MAEEEQVNVEGEQPELVGADGEETTESKPVVSVEEIENASVEAEKEKRRQERLERERPANLARVDFRQAEAKDIVSHHAGSILAHDGPVVPLTDEMLQKAKEVFKDLAITFDAPGEGEGEGEATVEESGENTADSESKVGVGSKKAAPPPVIEANRLPHALFRCGATPVDVDSMTELTGVSGAEPVDKEDESQEEALTGEDGGGEEGRDEGEGDEEGEGDGGRAVASKRDPSSAALSPLRDRRSEILKKAIAMFTQSGEVGTSEEKRAVEGSNLDAPEGSLEEGDFLSFVSCFYAPSYYYGQRLRRFVARGCIDDALLLLARGCNVNTSDGEGLSSLHYASEFNKTDIMQSLYAFSKGALKVNAKDKAGWTPLYCAVHHGHMEAVELLLSAPFNADVAAATNLGKAPLHGAAGQGRLAIADVLLHNKADASQRDFKGMTPLHDAAYKLHKDVYELLEEHPTCSIDAREELGYDAMQIFEGTTGATARK
jgi:hypothetical protein